MKAKQKDGIRSKTGKTSDVSVHRMMAFLEERQYIPNIAGVLLAQNASKIIVFFADDHEKYEGHMLDAALFRPRSMHFPQKLSRAVPVTLVIRESAAKRCPSETPEAGRSSTETV